MLSSSGQYSSLLLLQLTSLYYQFIALQAALHLPLIFFGISLEKNSFKSNSYFIRQSTTIWRTKGLLVIAKVRRTQRACALYCNSTSTFRPLLRLIFDIELNPGPHGSFNCSVKANTRNINNVKIAHLNVRSLKFTFCLLKRLFYQTNSTCLLYLKLG